MGNKVFNRKYGLGTEGLFGADGIIQNDPEELTQQGKMTELERRIIIELSKKVIDNIARKYERIMKDTVKKIHRSIFSLYSDGESPTILRKALL